MTTEPKACRPLFFVTDHWFLPSLPPVIREEKGNFSGLLLFLLAEGKLCLLRGEKGSSLDTGLATLMQNSFREPAVNWKKSSPERKIIWWEGRRVGGLGRKVLSESNLAENSVFYLIFLSISFSKTKDYLDQGEAFEVFFCCLNSFFH